MKCVKDYCLIKIEKKSDDSYIIGGHELFLYNGKLAFKNGQYNPNSRTRIYGEVVAIPDELSTDICDFGEHPLKDIPMDIMIGDTAFFYYIVLNDDNIINHNGQMLLRVRYDSIICVVRDKQIIPVSGHILLTPKNKTEIVLLYKVEKKQDLTGVVAFVSSPYIRSENEFEVGDTVHFLPDSEFENKIEGKDYWCMRSEYVLAKVEA